MENFKSYFFKLIKEDPDSSIMNGLGWTDSDARGFAIADGCIILAKVNTLFHNKMFDLCAELLDEEEKKKKITILGELPVEIEYGSASTRESFIREFPKGLIGRIWINSSEIAFWNKPSAFTVRNLHLLEDVFSFYNRIPSNFKFDITGDTSIGKPIIGYCDQCKILSWDEVQQLPEEQERKTNGGVEEWQKKLHTMSPEIKGQAMKAIGIRPKRGVDIQNKLGVTFGD